MSINKFASALARELVREFKCQRRARRTTTWARGWLEAWFHFCIGFLCFGHFARNVHSFLSFCINFLGFWYKKQQNDSWGSRNVCGLTSWEVVAGRLGVGKSTCDRTGAPGIVICIRGPLLWPRRWQSISFAIFANKITRPAPKPSSGRGRGRAHGRWEIDVRQKKAPPVLALGLGANYLAAGLETNFFFNVCRLRPKLYTFRV